MLRDLTEYYLRWYHTKPVAITSERRDELRRLHRVLYACICHFVAHYREFVPVCMPLSQREMDILAEQERHPFKAGTYRPDYIVANDGRLLLCEITSRFFAHGIFMSVFNLRAMERFLSKIGAPSCPSRFGEMMDYMLSIVGDHKRIFVFKSADKTSEIRLYKHFYEQRGIEVTVLEAEEVESHIDQWRHDAFLISALNQKDILRMSDTTLQAMMEAGMYSDFRNIFLIHDKRFMYLWFQDEFTSGCLNADDTKFLRAHAIPTFLGVPEEAFANKDTFIVKPCRLGKSEGLLPGPLTDEEEWQRRLRIDPEGMVTQPFIKQKTYPTVWEGTPFDDYICGMMLCVDDRYFDSGFFRCSSLPVTNIGDNRKACAIHTDDPFVISHCDLL